MLYSFDSPVDRRQTNSIKWDRYPEGVLPLWVADMDFTCSVAIQQALQRLVEHNVVGYSRVPDDLVKVVIQRLAERHGWIIEPDWLVWLPGMVPGLHASSMALGSDFSSILTSTPVYRPFLDAAQRPQREALEIPFCWKNSRWEMDFDALEKAIRPDTRMYMLCNPHNPNGRMFDEAELRQLGEFCRKHDLWICSDEIHCDLILDPTRKHLSIASLTPDLANRTITLLAPSKTYNIAGLGCSFAVIPNPDIRKAFQNVIYGILPHPNAYSHQAALAAYRDSQDWLDQALAYLRDNHAYLLAEINTIPGLSMQPLEATYLAWIDYRNLTHTNFTEILERFGVGVQDARQFGGTGFFRLNLATQRAHLVEAIRRIREAVSFVQSH